MCMKSTGFLLGSQTLQLSSVIILLLSFTPEAASASKDPFRDKEAFYLEELPKPPLVELTVTSIAGVFSTRTMNGHTRNTLPGEKVHLVAWNDYASLVKSTPGTSPSWNGWVQTRKLSPVDPELVNRIKAHREEEARFAEAIKDDEVIAGMTFKHVKKILGKPTSKAFRQDENGRFDTWTYTTFKRKVTYRQGYAANGQLVNIPVTVKVPVGNKTIEFKNGRVTAIEETQTPIK